MATERLKMVLDLLKKDPNDPFLVYASGLEYHKAGERDKAIHQFRQLLKSDPEYLGTYYQLGKLLEEEGNTEEAIEIYKAGVGIARKQNDTKTLGELNEALFLATDDEDEW